MGATWDHHIAIRRAVRCRAAAWSTLLCLLLAPTAAAQDPSPEAVRGEIRAGRYREAERQARELVAVNTRLYGEASIPVAESLDLLAESLRRGGKVGDPEALAVCLRSLRIKESILPSGDPSIANTLDNLGLLHVVKGNWVAARRPLERALEIREDAFGPMHKDVARSLVNLANLESSHSRDDLALTLVERAITIQDSVVSPEDPTHAMALQVLAAIRYRRGEYREAGRATEQVLSLQTRIYGPDHPTTLSTQHNLGALYVELGDYLEGKHYLERTLATMRRVLDPGHPLIARSLVVLGTNLELLGDFEGARKRYDEAVTIQRKAFGANSSELAWTTMKRGRLDLRLGHSARARKALRQALRIQEENLPPGDPDLGWTLTALAGAEAAQGELDSARAHCLRAVDIQERALTEWHPDLVPSLARLSRICAMSGDTVQAIEAALRSARIRSEHLRLTAGGLAERQALAYAAEGPTGLDAALILIGRPGPGAEPATVGRAWDAMIQTRTLVLDEMALRHHAALNDTADQTTKHDREVLRAARQRLANLLVRGPGSDTPEQYGTVIRLARTDVERAERSLGQRRPGFSSEAAEERLGLEAVIAALPPRWGLVAYASCEMDGVHQYVAFLLGTDRIPRALRIGDAERIDRLVGRWAADVQSSTGGEGAPARRAEAAARRSGHALRAVIWDAAASALGPVEGVFIVPDGALYAVNLAALPRDRGGYLVEDNMLLHYISSERDIITLSEPRGGGKGLLALGGVDFGSTPAADGTDRTGAGGAGDESVSHASTPDAWDCTGFRNVQFAPLPQSGLEVREIAATWDEPGEATVVTGSDATEAAFKRLAPGKRVIHLATHGFFLDPNSCLRSDTASRGIGGLETTVRVPHVPALSDRSPLRLSGLALALANRRAEAAFREEDGILTAEEVASLDLRGVELAVLSACDTGTSDAVHGEGVLGLRRAFHTAGVSTLVISLWPVQDQAAREWMGAFYRSRIHEGMNTATSVRVAMLEVLHGRRARGRSTNPFFWAAFLAAGDWK